MSPRETLVTVKVSDIVRAAFEVEDKLKNNKTSKQTEIYNIYQQ